ncbi:hypothetical protein FXO38_05518 [Capsicum annuum]|nr:hypothetical protein FXO38_05518 [Capsicum annuum]
MDSRIQLLASKAPFGQLWFRSIVSLSFQRTSDDRVKKQIEIKDFQNNTLAFFSTRNRPRYDRDKTAVLKGKQRPLADKEVVYLYDCNVCGLHLTSVGERKQHSKEMHKDYEICEHCGCGFRSKTAMATHQTPASELCILSLNKISGVKLKQWAATGVRAKNCELAEYLSEEDEEPSSEDVVTHVVAESAVDEVNLDDDLLN